MYAVTLSSEIDSPLTVAATPDPPEHAARPTTISPAAAAKAARPGLRISAAVYPELGAARRNVGQDWPQWLSKGLVEFVAPMNYQATTNQFQAYLTQQCETLGLKAAEQLLPGIGVTVKNLGLDEARRQVQATRNASLNGFILFEYNAQSAQGIVPFLMK